MNQKETSQTKNHLQCPHWGHQQHKASLAGVLRVQMVVALKSRGYLNSIKPRVRHVSNATASVPIEFVYIYFGIQLWNV